MINLFDLSAGASARVATRDGSPVRGTQSDRKEYADFKTVTGSMRRSSSDRSSGTPMKMLIAQEMAKEGDTNQKTSNVVARLMGLDDDVVLPKPVQPSNRRRSPEGHLSATLARADNQMPFDKHTSFVENVEYKDVYEVGYQPQRSEHLSNDSSRRGRTHEDHDQKRMDLVRQKFVEAKQLASHENLLQSKEFHDALEILNSNKDLFLKFLEEPNSLFAKQSGEFHPAPTSPQRKRITVLKPAKSVEMMSEMAIKRQQNHTVNGSRTEKSNLHRKSNAVHVKAERLPQHTRIVVLKPSSAITSVEQFQHGHGNPDDSEACIASRHLNNEINWSVHGMCHQHDESLQGGIQSNMLRRDRSYYDRAEEEGSSFSGLEIGSPASRHSWDYIYRFSNPYFSSSLSHASCSPESHVARETKKHTSDRWPSASSNEISQEKVLVRRSLSTLGEMLAMSDVKKEEAADQVATNAITSNQLCSNEPRLAVPSNCSINNGEGESSLRKISRSKSVPVSSSAFDSLHLDAGCSDPQHKEPTMRKDETKTKNGKSSLKGKISSFFSLRKKGGKEKLTPSPLGALNARVSVVNSDVSRPACTSLQDDIASENLEQKFENGRTVFPVNEPEAPSTSKAPISLEKALSFEIRNSHFDQPSPTSVLDASFEDGNEKSPSSPESAISAKQEPLSRCLPIGSVARTLSWDDSSEEAALCSSKEDCHEQEQYEFIEKILSSAGLCNENTNDIFVRWHSLDCPLGPSVLEQFLERKVEDAKCRERRSNQRLLIDSVNAALLDIGQSKLWGAYPCTGPNVSAQRVASDVLVSDEAWRLVKGWLSDDETHMVNGLDNAGMIADWVVGGEIQGRGWSEMLRLEVDEINKEISGEVLSELVEEAFSEFAGCH